MPRSLQVPAAPSYDEWEGLLSLRQMEKQISSQGQGGGRHDICKRRRRIKEELMGWSELLPLGRTPSIWGVTEITADAHIMEDNDSSTRLGTNNPNTAEPWSFITKSKKSQNTSLNRLSLSLYAHESPGLGFEDFVDLNQRPEILPLTYCGLHIWLEFLRSIRTSLCSPLHSFTTFSHSLLMVCWIILVNS